MVRSSATVVRDVLSAVDPDHSDRYDANHDEFAGSIDELDRAVRIATDTLAPAERLLFTYHDDYAYLAREYGWEVVGAVQPSSSSEPTPREVAALIDQLRDRGVGVTFGSAVFPSPVLGQIAAETALITSTISAMTTCRANRVTPITHGSG